MKKVLLTGLLIPLILFELVLSTGFLPLGWQQAISERIPQILLKPPDDWSGVTHPRMDLELEAVFRQHVWLRIAYYVVLALLVAGNAALIRLVWRRRRGAEKLNVSRS